MMFSRSNFTTQVIPAVAGGLALWNYMEGSEVTTSLVAVVVGVASYAYGVRDARKSLEADIAEMERGHERDEVYRDMDRIERGLEDRIDALDDRLDSQVNVIMERMNS